MRNKSTVDKLYAIRCITSAIAKLCKQNPQCFIFNKAGNGNLDRVYLAATRLLEDNMDITNQVMKDYGIIFNICHYNSYTFGLVGGNASFNTAFSSIQFVLAVPDVKVVHSLV